MKGAISLDWQGGSIFFCGYGSSVFESMGPEPLLNFLFVFRF